MAWPKSKARPMCHAHRRFLPCRYCAAADRRDRVRAACTAMSRFLIWVYLEALYSDADGWESRLTILAVHGLTVDRLRLAWPEGAR